MPIDYSKYPLDWHSRIRPAVLERAKNCCEECGVENHRIIKRESGSYIYVDTHNFTEEDFKVKNLKANGYTKIVLTIAHLDHDASNFDVELDRLRAWCQKCHLAFDLPRHIHKRKYGMNVFKSPTLFDEQ